MEKWIIWFLPDNKKIQLRSFTTEAKTMQEALDNFKNNTDFAHKVMGVSGYYNLGGVSKEVADEKFVNNKHY